MRSVLRGWLARLGLPEREPDAIDETAATWVLRRGVDQRWSPSDWMKWAGSWRTDYVRYKRPLAGPERHR